MGSIGVYILKCSNDRFYVGSTNSIERRLEEHKRGKSKSTQNLLPIELVKFLPCLSLVEARQLELYIKKQKSSVYIEKLIASK